MIRATLIDTNKYLPKNAIRDILDIIPYNNRYTKSYLSFAKRISDDYNVKQVNNILPISNFMFYKEYGIILDKSKNFKEFEYDDLDIFSENTIYRIIMDNNKEKFIQFIESDEFDKDQKRDG